MHFELQATASPGLLFIAHVAVKEHCMTHVVMTLSTAGVTSLSSCGF
jgi:hypothetical protein